MRSKKAKIKCNKKLAAGGVFFIKIAKELIGKFYEKYAKNYGARLCGGCNTWGSVRLCPPPKFRLFSGGGFGFCCAVKREIIFGILLRPYRKNISAIYKIKNLRAKKLPRKP